MMALAGARAPGDTPRSLLWTGVSELVLGEMAPARRGSRLRRGCSPLPPGAHRRGLPLCTFAAAG